MKTWPAGPQGRRWRDEHQGPVERSHSPCREGLCRGRVDRTATGGTIPVVNPATGETIATVPDLGAGETRDAIAAASGRSRPGGPSRGQERCDPAATLARPDARQRRRPRRDHDRRAGQAARRSTGRDRLCAPLHRVVRRGSASASTATSSRGHQPDKRILVLQAAGRRRRRDHAVEFPGAMITRKAGPGARRGLHRWSSSRPSRRRSPPSPWRSWRSAPVSRRACSTSSRAMPVGDRRRAHRQPERAQAHLHRVDAVGKL